MGEMKTINVEVCKEVEDVFVLIEQVIEAAKDGVQLEDLMQIMNPLYEAVKGAKSIDDEFKAMFEAGGKPKFDWFLTRMTEIAYKLAGK